MTVAAIDDVEFGMELDPFEPDTSLSSVREFANAVGWGGGGRFNDHAKARKEGLPGALVPGIMAMGFLTTMIHRWSPAVLVAPAGAFSATPGPLPAPFRPSAGNGR